jgi:uridylate kinase
MLKHRRILLKLSGEILIGDRGFGIDQTKVNALAKSIKNLQEFGCQIGIVIGAGNIYRGVDLREEGFSRTPADHMGMLATFFNGMALEQVLNRMDVKVAVMSALECPKIVESYNWNRAMEYLNAETILIFVGGTGNPYFTTDTAAALRASEIEADILMKATKVDGIYDKDPIKHLDAVKYTKITYAQILAEKLQVMDATAVALCQSNRIPIYVFNMKNLFDHSPSDVLNDWDRGTLVQ